MLYIRLLQPLVSSLWMSSNPFTENAVSIRESSAVRCFMALVPTLLMSAHAMELKVTPLQTLHGEDYYAVITADRSWPPMEKIVQKTTLWHHVLGCPPHACCRCMESVKPNTILFLLSQLPPFSVYENPWLPSCHSLLIIIIMSIFRCHHPIIGVSSP